MSSNLFLNPPLSIGDVFTAAFSICKEHWKTLGLISIFQLLSLAGTVIVLSNITRVVAGSYIAILMLVINSITGGEFGGGNDFNRVLMEYTTGIHGAHRLLDANYDNLDFDDDITNVIMTDTIVVLVSIVVVWAVTLSLVSSLFMGAFYHALGNIYTGGFPSIRDSMSHGKAYMWSVYCYQLYCLAFFIVLGILMIALPIASLKPGVILLGFLLFIISIALTSSLMTGAVPSIIIEHKSATQAIVRSLDLCKGFLCFIFCTQFSYMVTVIVLSILFNLFFNHLPGILAFVGHIIVNIATSVLGPL